MKYLCVIIMSIYLMGCGSTAVSIVEPTQEQVVGIVAQVEPTSPPRATSTPEPSTINLKSFLYEEGDLPLVFNVYPKDDLGYDIRWGPIENHAVMTFNRHQYTGRVDAVILTEKQTQRRLDKRFLLTEDEGDTIAIGEVGYYTDGADYPGISKPSALLFLRCGVVVDMMLFYPSDFSDYLLDKTTILEYGQAIDERLKLIC